ncbi:MAG: phosphopeptide-binding protein, partial [Cyanobacteria bacterium PR.023]|nr:phosphopeptide-binding protein [Cyanobacteria bacterium PR.023]
MEIAICPNCGAVIKQKVKGCGACGAAQSKFAATMVPTLASAA